LARFFIQHSLFPTEVQARPVRLRSYQQQALMEFLKRKKGVIEAATGVGKTFIAIEALRRLDLPAVILAPTIPIMKTVWKKRLREYGFPSVGLYYGDEKRDGAKILVATYQSAIKHQHIMKRPMIIMDECLPYDAKVALEDGSQLPIGEIVEKKLPVKVLSYNVKTGKIEPKRVTHYFKVKKHKPLVTVEHEKGSLVLTADHKVFTLNRGYVLAEDLKSGDMMLYIEDDKVQNLRERIQEQTGSSGASFPSLPSEPKICWKKSTTEMDERASRLLRENGKEILKRTNRRGKPKLQGAEKCQVDRETEANNSGRLIGRPLHSQRKLAASSKSKSFSKISRVGILAILRVKGVRYNSAERDQKSWIRKSTLCICNMLPQSVHGDLRAMLPQWQEDDYGGLVEPDKQSNSFGSMVYDGWGNLITQLSNDNFNSQFFSRGTKIACEMAESEMGLAELWHCNREGQAERKVFSEIPIFSKGAVFRPNQTIHSSIVSIQDSPANRACAMCNMRETGDSIEKTVCALEEAWNKSLLQSRMQKNSRENAEQDEASEKEEYVYDIEVEDNHNFFADGILVSNCHHVSSPVWSKLLDYVPQAEYVLGLTATLGRRWGERYKTVTRFLPVIFSYEIWKARMDGWVADTRIFSVPVKLTPLEMGEYERLCDMIRTAIFKLGTHDPTEWRKLAKEGNETAKKALWALTRRRILLSKAENKLTATLSIIYHNMKYGKILLFTESIDAVEILKRFLAKHGISALTYHSKMPKQKRASNLKRWGSGNVKVLLSVRALDEGIDVPDASVGVFHASGRTKRQIVQRLGRILRPKPDGSPAKIYVVWAERTIERHVLDEVVRAVRKARR